MTFGLEQKTCTKPTWHGPHHWWYTSSGGGHMMIGDPTPTDFEVEKGLIEYNCPGNPEPDIMSAPRPEPESEQMIAAYQHGVEVGRKQMIELFHEALQDVTGQMSLPVLERVEELFAEAGIKP